MQEVGNADTEPTSVEVALINTDIYLAELLIGDNSLISILNRIGAIASFDTLKRHKPGYDLLYKGGKRRGRKEERRVRVRKRREICPKLSKDVYVAGATIMCRQSK